MKKCILLDPGILPYYLLKDKISDYIVLDNDLCIINDNPKKNGWDLISSHTKYFYYLELEKVNANKYSPSLISIYDAVLKAILSDHRTILIAERINILFGWNSVFNQIYKIEILVANCISLLNDIKPDILFFHSTPHSLHSWVLAKTAEYLRVKVNFIQNSPLPWRYWIVEGLDEQIPIFPKENLITDDKDEFILNEFLRINSSSYKEALPSYERNRIAIRGGRFWSWKKEIMDCFGKPKQFLKVFPKRHLYNVYNKSITIPDLSKKYVVHFLHYQPERTSLPEGGLYSQQWIIIRALSSLLPEGWLLYVKEHPSTFTGFYDFRYRNPSFYKNILALKNVYLMPLETDTFTLIDNSQLVVTITGTVGVQSLIRGKPVLVFGVASYRNIPGVFTISNLSDLVKIFDKISNTRINDFSTEKVLLTLENLLKETVSGIDDFDKNSFDIYKKEIRINGNTRLLGHYFEYLSK